MKDVTDFQISLEWSQFLCEDSFGGLNVEAGHPNLGYVVDSIFEFLVTFRGGCYQASAFVHCILTPGVKIPRLYTSWSCKSDPTTFNKANCEAGNPVGLSVVYMSLK